MLVDNTDEMKEVIGLLVRGMLLSSLENNLLLKRSRHLKCNSGKGACDLERVASTEIHIITYSTYYYINISEIPGNLSREKIISSHVKITCYFHM